MVAPAIRLLPLTLDAMKALVSGERARASEIVGVDLPGFFAEERMIWLCNYRINQIEADPASAGWLVRGVVSVADGAAVGHAGFHGPRTSVAWWKSDTRFCPSSGGAVSRKRSCGCCSIVRPPNLRSRWCEHPFLRTMRHLWPQSPVSASLRWANNGMTKTAWNYCSKCEMTEGAQ